MISKYLSLPFPFFVLGLAAACSTPIRAEEAKCFDSQYQVQDKINVYDLVPLSELSTMDDYEATKIVFEPMDSDGLSRTNTYGIECELYSATVLKGYFEFYGYQPLEKFEEVSYSTPEKIIGTTGAISLGFLGSSFLASVSQPRLNSRQQSAGVILGAALIGAGITLTIKAFSKRKVRFYGDKENIVLFNSHIRNAMKIDE